MVKEIRKQNVQLPTLDNNETTLEKEIDWAKELTQHILRITERADAKTVRIYGLSDAILRFLLSESRKTVDDISRGYMLERVRNSVSKNKPIPISITVALGIRFLNPLKHKESSNPPTAAWLYNIYKLNLIAERVRRFYPPGIVFYLFEEGYVLMDLFGISKETVDRNLEITREMIVSLNAPLKIIPLLPEHFPKDRMSEMNLSNIEEADIFAIMCSLPDMQSRKIMDMLYQKKEKPFSEIKRQMENIWKLAAEIALAKTELLVYRKKVKLFQHLLTNMNGNADMEERLLDAAVTEKEGRLSFRFTGGTLFSHGAAVLERNGDGKNSCAVVPEYKLANASWKDQGKRKFVKPIYMNLRGARYIWAYEVV